MEAAGRQGAGEFTGQPGSRGPAERADLAQGAQHHPDPEQADFVRRLATFPEVLIQPWDPGEVHRAPQLILGQQADVGLGAGGIVARPAAGPGPRVVVNVELFLGRPLRLGHMAQIQRIRVQVELRPRIESTSTSAASR